MPVVSIDVPSGWDVCAGDVRGDGLLPDCLISLTSPKACARRFVGRHHALGGRFISRAFAAQHHIDLPPYQAADQFVDITHYTLQPAATDTETTKKQTHAQSAL